MLDGLQTLLDLGGLVPGFGEPLDLLNAGVSAARWDRIGAGLSMAGMVPIGGQLATAGKIGRRRAKSIANYEKHITKLSDARDALAQLRKNLCDAKGPKRKGPDSEPDRQAAEGY